MTFKAPDRFIVILDLSHPAFGSAYPSEYPETERVANIQKHWPSERGYDVFVAVRETAEDVWRAEQEQRLVNEDQALRGTLGPNTLDSSNLPPDDERNTAPYAKAHRGGFHEGCPPAECGVAAGTHVAAYVPKYGWTTIPLPDDRAFKGVPRP